MFYEMQIVPKNCAMLRNFVYEDDVVIMLEKDDPDVEQVNPGIP